MTTADPNDLAEFYGNEDFMEIFCVFPFMVDFMMRSGHFDDNGHVHTFGLPPVVSNMVVSMQFDEREEEDGDGETNTVCFNKKERFKCTDAFFGTTLWEMVQNFGYAQREDGTCEVYHYGQKWQGPFFIRLIFQMHARYVIFAAEQHLNSPRFLGKQEDDADEDAEIAQRHNIPFHLLGQFLDGLEGDVQVQLAKAAAQVAKASKDIDPSDKDLVAMQAKVAQLELLVEELKRAKLRRQATLDEAPVQKKKTLVRRTATATDVTREGSARGFYQRALQRRATQMEMANADDDDDVDETTAALLLSKKANPANLAETITAALEHVEAEPAPAAIRRRVTAIEDELQRVYTNNKDAVAAEPVAGVEVAVEAVAAEPVAAVEDLAEPVAEPLAADAAEPLAAEAVAAEPLAAEAAEVVAAPLAAAAEPLAAEAAAPVVAAAPEPETAKAPEYQPQISLRFPGAPQQAPAYAQQQAPAYPPPYGYPAPHAYAAPPAGAPPPGAPPQYPPQYYYPPPPHYYYPPPQQFAPQGYYAPAAPPAPTPCSDEKSA